ncbi:MAG TPA: hypothetical protein DCY20_04165 [Firmicutes bacterium]|nr:hypothetical protein [Bacillota bacterium]
MSEQRLSWNHLNSSSRELIESLLRKEYRELYYKLESRPSITEREALVKQIMSILVEKNINISQEDLHFFLEARSLFYDDLCQRQLELK